MSTDSRFLQVRKRLEHVEAKPPPGLLFDPFRQVDDVLHLSGELPFVGEQLPVQYQGSVGRDVTVDNAVKAAQITTLNLLASAQRAIGSLDNVGRAIEAFGFVSSSDGFFGQSSVMNGCSSLLLEILGETRGRHSRGAIGVHCLPLRSCIEIKLTLHIDCVGVSSYIQAAGATNE